MAQRPLRGDVFLLRRQRPATAHRRQLSQGVRLSVEREPGQATELCEESPASPTRGQTRRRAAHTPLLCRCVSSHLGYGPGVLLLVAGWAAFSGGGGFGTQTLEHPGGLLPR